MELFVGKVQGGHDRVRGELQQLPAGFGQRRDAPHLVPRAGERPPQGIP